MLQTMIQCVFASMHICMIAYVFAVTSTSTHPVQFERTLIVAEEGSYVSYLEGCTAPAYDQNQVRLKHGVLHGVFVYILWQV